MQVLNLFLRERTNNKSKRKIMKKLVIGILAHVDAGKTTLSEGMLYTSGVLRKLGRVDHKDAFLDNFSLEKERGITIFSKQARFVWKDMEVTLLDTPGHVDFSTEMERTLQVLDYAILVINGSDGVQGHTETLWRLLKRYEIPTFLFVNKMDLVEQTKEGLLGELLKKLSDNCVDFSSETKENKPAFYENIAMCDEEALDMYMETEAVEHKKIIELIARRKLFPCLFGSALKMDGIEEFLNILSKYTVKKEYPQKFGAKVYKIARDEQNNRLTYMKITGGILKVKTVLSNQAALEDGREHGELWEEKVNQIRLYSGERYEAVSEVAAGEVCAVLGLEHTFPGQGLGADCDKMLPLLEPVLTYQIVLEPEVDGAEAFRKMKVLEEEDPQLHVVWDEKLREIHVQLMGEVQTEILKQVIKDRFGYLVTFGEGNLVYKETIANVVEGVGHFEPLRHYAEVHLLLEAGEQGSGLQFFTDCSEDLLDKNWQRLIYTHLEEKEHLGVLTGAPITDMKITLVAGKAHTKHTEGGDFRQATYRAIRQGLKLAESVLLEPYYQFSLHLPMEQVGRAMNDIQRMNGTFQDPEISEGFACIQGKAPVSTMRGYIKEVHGYTRGKGRLECQLLGYLPCHNQEEVVEQIGYDSESDLENPTCSVFCAHGSGFLVPWNEVSEYMHIEYQKKKEIDVSDEMPVVKRQNIESLERQEADLQQIMLREFGEKRKRFDDYGNVYYSEEERKTLKPINIEKNAGDPKYEKKPKKQKLQKEYLLVDGYNIIFSWQELNELSKTNLDAARMALLDCLCNYQGYHKKEVIVVFDAYKVKGNPGSVEAYHNIHVVFTKEAETADVYIEKVTHEIGKQHKVTVATSDGLEQVIIMQQGALRMSATDLKKHIEWTEEQIGLHLS